MPSFAVFLRQIIPALNVRLRRSKHLLGAKCTVDLVIATYQPARPAAILKIHACQVIEVEEVKLPVPTRAKNLRGVRGHYEAIVALLMGRLGWRKVCWHGGKLLADGSQLREVMPDLQVWPADIMLIDALFPPHEPTFPEYLE